MRWLRIVRARMVGLWRRDAIADEIREELRFHMEMRTEEYELRGLSPEAARRQARRRVGNLAVHQDEGYDIRGGGMMETILQDIRYSVRLLLKQRGFALVAVITLAIAIGAVTAVVSVIDAAILRPLPYPHPEQLVDVSVAVSMPDGRDRNMGPSIDDIRGWLAFDDVISAVAASRQVFYGRLIAGEQPERVQITEATEGLLTLYGVAPLHGRDLRRDDTLPGAEPVVLLGYGYWQRRFGGDPAVVGQALRFDDEVATIIGVLPPHFGETEVLQALRTPTDRLAARGTGTDVEARLVPGVTPEQAAERLLARIDEMFGENTNRPAAVQLTSVLERTTGRRWGTVTVLSGSVALILVLACVNVAGLQLARGAVRGAELAVRASLGAGRGRLVRQLMIENGVLALVGALVGLFFAWVSLDALVANLPLSLPSTRPVGLNLLVLAISMVVVVGTTMLFGAAPAWRLSHVAGGRSLAGGGRLQGRPLPRRASQLLIAVEVGLAVVLVVGAVLMLRSFDRVMSVDIGIDPASFLTVEAFPLVTDATVQAAYYSDLVRELRLLPGIEAVGAIDHLPMAGHSSVAFFEVGGEPASLEIRSVLPGYAKAMAIPVIAGRLITDADLRGGARVAMINEAAAAEMFPNSDAVGQTFQRVNFEEGERVLEPWEVIGIIGDVRHNGPLYAPRPELFLPVRSSDSMPRSPLGMTVVVRPSAGTEELAQRLRTTAEGLGTPVVVERIRTGEDWLAGRIVTPRQRTVLLSLLGGLGLLLALVGVFGLTAYAVARRTREIGVRMTFGARPGQVVGTIVRDSAIPVAGGIALGLLGAYYATRVIESFLYETAPTEPMSFIAVAVILAITGCLAAWIPARRAARVDPVTALGID